MDQIEKTYKCEICSKECISYDDLQVHQISHGQKRKIVFLCSICNKTFYNNQNREQHEKYHSLVVKEQYQCPICNTNRLYKFERYLKLHLKEVHSEKPHACKVCDKSFSRKESYRQHMRTHTEERPFQCEICNKAFCQKSNLRVHKKTTHRKEKNHQCPICSVSYTRRRLLAYHLYAKHSNEKPLSCCYCDKRFIYPSVVREHMQRCKFKTQKQPKISEAIFNDQEPNLEDALKSALGEKYLEYITQKNKDLKST